MYSVSDCLPQLMCILCVGSRLGEVVNLMMGLLSVKYKTRCKLAFLLMLTLCKCQVQLKVSSCHRDIPGIVATMLAESL